MTNLIFDNKTYDIEQLPDDAKAQVVSMQFVDAEIQRLNAMIAVFQTARHAYIKALRPQLVALECIAIKPRQH